MQQSLFEPMMAAYASGVPIHNRALYARLASDGAIAPSALLEQAPVGKSKASHNLTCRKARWLQQSMRQLGLIEKVPGQRGVWRSTDKARGELTPAPHKRVLLAFSTQMGLALWGDCADVFSAITEPLALLLTSPPYPLSRARAYGGPTEPQFVDFMCAALEPVVRRLLPGGSIAVVLTNDVFLKGSPARAMLQANLLIALNQRLGLHHMDSIIWHDNSKAPGPIAWASKKRVHLHTGYESVLWLCNDPAKAFSNNQRVLQPHTQQHLTLVAKGGDGRTASYGDGANRIKPGAYSKPTAGRIPRNVLSIPHRCRSQDAMRKQVKAEGLPLHGATYPLTLARFLIEFLTEPGQLVADTFGGWITTGLAAELTGRRWIVAEKNLQYLEGARFRFQDLPGYDPHHLLPHDQVVPEHM